MSVTITDHTPSRPKVSIIMLAYNNKAYIRTAISAVLNQKAPFDFQLVLSDDCSTDSTLQICRDYAARFPSQITLVEHFQNVGIPRNFLDAHKACKGDYIAMCDGDDYWCYSKKLQVMVDFMDKHPDYSLCFHRVINSYEHNHTKSLSNGAQHKREYELADLCAGNFITNCSCLFRRSCCPTPPEWISEVLLCDYAMHILNAMHGKVHYFPKPMAVYRKHKKTLWTGVKEAQRFSDALFTRQKALELLEHARPKEYAIMVDNYTRAALSYIVSAEKEGMDTSEARERLAKLHPEWTKEEMLQKIEERKNLSLSPSLSSRIATGLRSIVSRAIPLPHIKIL